MKDTIYREDAINCLCNGKCLDEMRWCDDGYCPPVTRIKQLPSTQPERKRGHWIEVDDSYNRISGRCSVCGWESHMYEDDVVGMDFCPHCGADLRGGSHVKYD